MSSILKRRSIRKYLDKEIPQNIIQNLLEAAMSAPSAGNEKPWQFIVSQKKEHLEGLSETSPYSKVIRKAPLGIVICGDLQKEVYKGFWVQDCAAATENILIAAVENGLGSVWLGVYPLEDRIAHIRQIFSLPEHIVPFAILPIGFPDEIKETKSRYDETRVHVDKW